eukprot:98404-Prymnesium_polylepis.1
MGHAQVRWGRAVARGQCTVWRAHRRGERREDGRACLLRGGALAWYHAGTRGSAHPLRRRPLKLRALRQLDAKLNSSRYRISRGPHESRLEDDTAGGESKSRGRQAQHPAMWAASHLGSACQESSSNGALATWQPSAVPGARGSVTKAAISSIGRSDSRLTLHRLGPTCVNCEAMTIGWPGTKQQNDMARPPPRSRQPFREHHADDKARTAKRMSRFTTFCCSLGTGVATGRTGA